MKQLLLLLTFLFKFAGNAQDTTHVNTVYKGGEKNEYYYRDGNGNKIGKYLRYTRYGNTYIEGQYYNGQPVGVWNYYTAENTGKLVQTLNFDAFKETFLDTVNVPSLICGPRYFGGNMAKQEYVQYRISTDFTPAEHQRLKGTSVMAVFDIDTKTYKTNSISVDDPALSEDLRAKMVKIIREMPAWLPPICKGGTPVWRMSVVFLFQ